MNLEFSVQDIIVDGTFCIYRTTGSLAIIPASTIPRNCATVDDIDISGVERRFSVLSGKLHDFNIGEIKLQRFHTL